ncbi:MULTISPECIES: gamma-glutamyl-gamma-aminobutyrate hydrolase family protein [Bacillaceae]|uniref:Gamma-glutamyl-gamma-aminobutyrate hydrolase family protein n=1 Tax=Evansella alkalicola TaxID=745819 RepID=A0ABS6JV13_9BACI|nr:MULTISPECIES: gamma-glutamyl-gamma-aminobutyrate hydrolase family protein [Bacillaceae]MBU9722423.1 gamma-glutamyl-gamma-aminobutyrate hydrolase family protein [Bacillus alkalicola]
MKKPLIGVLPLYDAEKDSYWMVPGYMKGIEEAGGIPVMLPLTTDLQTIQTLASTYDGFLFTGGQDVDPSIYGETALPECGEICRERDAMEKMLYQELIKSDKTVFGICRAIQLFNALLGGALYQDLPTQRIAEPKLLHKQKPPYDKLVHSVFLKKEGLLYDILETDKIMVNSYHHQGIKTLADKLVCIATVEDGLVEAVAKPDQTFHMAVQWHPEFSYKSDLHSRKLFEAFVEACKLKTGALI